MRSFKRSWKRGNTLTIPGKVNSQKVFSWFFYAKNCFPPPHTHSCPYVEEQPKKKPGMIFWLTGVPGSGKSTTCQLMARNHGFVYLEVDGYTFMINPFPDLNKGNPSVSAHVNKALKVSIAVGCGGKTWWVQVNRWLRQYLGLHGPMVISKSNY